MTSSPPRSNWVRAVVVAVLVASVAGFYLFGPDEQTILNRSAQWRNAAQNHLLQSLALFFIAEVVVIALSIPVGLWMSVLAGFLFGLGLGVVVVALAATLGAILAFLAARYVFFEAIHRGTEQWPRVRRWQKAIDVGLEEHGAYYVLLLRLTPVIPFWAVNLGLGLTRLRLRDYSWTTQLGILPATVVIVNAGASLGEITSLRGILSVRVLLALCLLPLVPFVLRHTIGRWLRKAS